MNLCVCVCVCVVCVCVLVAQLSLNLAAPWTAARQILSIEFSRQEYWSGLPFPSLGDLSDPGIEPSFLLCRQILDHLSH